MTMTMERPAVEHTLVVDGLDMTEAARRVVEAWKRLNTAKLGQRAPLEEEYLRARTAYVRRARIALQCKPPGEDRTLGQRRLAGLSGVGRSQVEAWLRAEEAAELRQDLAEAESVQEGEL